MWKLVCGIAVASSVAVASEAGEPRQVRIIWNVSAATACVYAAPLGAAPWWLPSVPIDAQSPCPNPPKDSAYRLLRKAPSWKVEVEKGDYVSVFAVHYNPVSYKPRDAKAVVLVPQEPPFVTAIGALVQVITKAAVAAQAAPPEAPAQPSGAPPKRMACTFTDVTGAEACLDDIQTHLAELQVEASLWIAQDWARKATTLAGELKRTPRSLMGMSPGDAAAWLTPAAMRERVGFNPDDMARQFSCVPSRVAGQRISPLGGICAGDGFVERVRQHTAAVAGRLELFDISVGVCPRPGCVNAATTDRRRQMGTAFDSVAQLLAGNPDATWAAGGRAIDSLNASFATLAAYRRSLRPEGAGEHFVELPAQNDVGALNTIVFSLPLEAEDGGSQVVHHLTVKVGPHYPWVLASAGVIYLPWRGLPFQKLTINQEPVTGSDGSLTLQKVLQTTDDSGAIRPVAGLAATSFRVPGPRLPGVHHVYGTIGTTVDNNIFRTLVLGGSVFFPRLRSSVTAGALMSWGTTKEDLADTIARYSVNGVALDGLDVGKIAIDRRRHTMFVVGWTLSAF